MIGRSGTMESKVAVRHGHASLVVAASGERGG